MSFNRRILSRNSSWDVPRPYIRDWGGGGGGGYYHNLRAFLRMRFGGGVYSGGAYFLVGLLSEFYSFSLTGTLFLVIAESI